LITQAYYWIVYRNWTVRTVLSVCVFLQVPFHGPLALVVLLTLMQGLTGMALGAYSGLCSPSKPNI